MTMTMIQIDALHESKSNPRTIRDAARDAELEASVREHGVLTPLLVRKVGAGFEIVFGSRRYRAAKAAGLTDVPAETRELDDATVRELQLVENSQRADVHPLDEADAYKALVDEYNYDAERIAAKVSKPIAHVRQRLKLVELGAPGRTVWLAGKITEDAAYVLARLPAKVQAQAVKHAVEAGEPAPWEADAGHVFEPVTGSSMREIVRDEFSRRMTEVPFPADDVELVAKAGACTTCPKRTGAQGSLFGDFATNDLCLDEACWKTKCNAHFVRLKKRGLEALDADVVKRVFPYPDSRPGYGCGYEKVDGELRDLLEKAGTPIYLAQAPNGDPVVLVRSADAKKAEKKLPKSEPSTKEREQSEKAKAERAAAKQETAIREFVATKQAEAMVESAERAKLEDEGRLRALVIAAIEVTIDDAHFVRIAERRGLKVDDAATGKVLTHEEVLRRLAATSKVPALRGLLVEILFGQHDGVDRELLAKAFGVNLKTVATLAEKEARKAIAEGETKRAAKSGAKKGGKR